MCTIKVSVIIPIYNDEKYLPECIDSVLSQTMTEFEVICIDDCSTDDSFAIVNKYAEMASRIHVYQNKNNEGPSATRNCGIEAAQGEYIFFLDADDFIRADTFELLLERAKSCDADIVQFAYHHKFEEGVKVWYRNPKANYHNLPEVYSGKEFFCELVNNRIFEAQACIRMFRREFLMENQIKFYEGILHEDYLFSFLSFMNAKKVVCCDEDLYTYRKHPKGITNRTDILRSQSYFIVFTEVWKYWNDNGDSKELSKAISVLERDLFNMYMAYEGYEAGNYSLPFGTCADKWLYKTITKHTAPAPPPIEYIHLTDEMISSIRSHNNIFIYGAGNYGKELYNKLSQLDIYVESFLVSENDHRGKLCLGRKIIAINDLVEVRDMLILVAVSSKIEDEIVRLLKVKGYRYLLLHE